MTPTDEDEDRHQVIEVKPDSTDRCITCAKRNSPECGGPCWRRDEVVDEKAWWYWFRIEIPPKPRRGDFFRIIAIVLINEIAFGPVIGSILRSTFGWPF